MPDAEVAAPSIAGALAEGTRRLAAAGQGTARLDAEVLLAWVLGVDRARLVLDHASPVAAEDLRAFAALVARRAAGEPVAYLTGRRAFRRLWLSVDPRVLIPRPETELLVEVGLTLPAGAAVVDVGTGSGAIALALKDERPDLRVTGVDLSADAVAVARDNAAALGLEAEFLVGDLLSPVDETGIDAVLANLPYVAEDDPLPVEVAGYEPPAALFAGADGLDVVRRLVSDCQSVPLLALEVGAGQAAAVRELLGRTGFAVERSRRDLAGHERVLVGRR